MSVIHLAKNANDFSETDMDYFKINWRLATTDQFFGTETLPTPEYDPCILDQMNMLENPNCTAEAVQLRRHLMRGHDESEDNCHDYIYSLLNFCGYLIFPRYVYRNVTVPFCSYYKKMECKFDLVLFKAGTEQPLLFAMSSPSLVDGIPKVIAAATAMYRYHGLGSDKVSDF